MFVAGRNDTVVPLADFDENLETLDVRGIRHEIHINEPSPVAADSFTRVPGIDTSLSADIFTAVENAGLLDPCGVQINDPASSGWESTLPPAAASFLSEIRNQLKELYSAHTFTSDFTSEILSFFTTQSGALPGKLHVVKPAKLAKLVARSRTIAPDKFDLPESGTAEDPTLVGARLVFADIGLVAGSVAYDLDVSGWSGIGNPAGARGYKYKARDDVTVGNPSAACSIVLIKEKVIKAVCKRESVTLVPPYGGVAAVNLGIPGGSASAIQYCWEFGGDEKKISDVIMKRKDAAAPGACQSIGN